MDFDHDRAAPGDFSIGSTIQVAFDVTWRTFPLWLLVGFVGTLLMVLSTITIIGYFVLVPVFFWGMTKFLLNMHDGKAAFEDLFSGFSNFGSVLGRSLVMLLLWILLSIVGNSVSFIGQITESFALQTIGSIVNLAFTAVVAVRLYFSFFFLVDQDMRPMEAISASWNVTRGKTLKCLGLMIVAVIVTLAGLVAFIVGVFFTIMMSYVMYASAYRSLAGDRAALPAR